MQVLFDLMDTIRTEILENLMIPGLGISWWKFSIYLLIISVVVTVLINAVKVSGSNAGKSARRRHIDDDEKGE